MPNINEILNNCGFVRETKDDLQELVQKGYPLFEVISKIISPKTPTTDLFCLSVYLYGFNPQKRLFPYDIYFYCDKLYEQPISNETTKEEYIFSYRYDPIIGSQSNPCHFIFCVRDLNGNYLPREAKTKSEQKHNKALAKLIIESFLVETVCLDKNELRVWDINNNQLLENFV